MRIAFTLRKPSFRLRNPNSAGTRLIRPHGFTGPRMFHRQKKVHPSKVEAIERMGKRTQFDLSQRAHLHVLRFVHWECSWRSNNVRISRELLQDTEKCGRA